MNDYEIEAERSQVAYSLTQAARTVSTAMSTATIQGTVMWDGKPVIEDDGDEGSAPVREPRNPGPSSFPPAAVALVHA